APEDELVVAHVLQEGFHVLAAVFLCVLEPRAEVALREADEDHLVPGRRQAPTGGSGRHVGAITRRGVGGRVAGGTGEARGAQSQGAALDVLVVGETLVELEGRVTRDVAVLAARVLEDRLHGVERRQGSLVGGRGARGTDRAEDQRADEDSYPDRGEPL